MKRTIVIKTLAMLLVAVSVGLGSEEANAENKFTLTGSVRDRLTNSYVMDADVECLDATDSVVGNATAFKSDYDFRRQASTWKGEFSLVIPRVKGRYKLRFSHEEFDTVTVPLNLTDIGSREHDRELGTFYMERHKTVQLDELEVKGSKIMFYNRGDTLVYNASAFELAEGSMLDALIEQLPGVELREGGEIYVNGKFVQSLLLNGKDFFKGNNQLMLDNLAAYTVKDIEVYDKQTDRGRFLGLNDKANKEYVMDVKLKKEYIGGWIINAEAAGGTHGRGLARLFAMNFSALSQFTLLGNVNNLNDDTRPTAEDKWDPEKQADGVRSRVDAGFDYSTENAESTRKASGNLQYRQNRRSVVSNTSQTQYLPGQNTLSSSNSNSLTRDFQLSTDHTLHLQTSRTAVTLTPRLTLNRDKSSSHDEGSSTLDNPLKDLINSTIDKAFGKSGSISGNCDLDVTIKVPRTSDAIDLEGGIYFDADHTERETSRIIRYGDPSIPSDARHSRTDNDPTHYLVGNFGAQYNLILNSNANISLSYRGRLNRRRESSAYYLGLLDAGYTGDYTLEHLEQVKMEFDPLNSHRSLSTSFSQEMRAEASFKFSDNWEIRAGLPIRHQQSKLDYNQDGIAYPASYAAWLFEPTLSINWNKFTKGASSQVFISGMRYTNLPQLTALITIPDTRNPLSQFVGNPDLKHYSTNYFNITAMKTGRNLSLFTSNNLYLQENYFSSSYIYDLNSGKQTYKTVNVDGNWRFESNSNVSYFWGKLNLNFRAQFNYSHDVSHSMLGTNDSELTRIRRTTDKYKPAISAIKYFGSNYNQRNNISLSIEPEFTRSKSTDVNDSRINPVDVNYKLAGKFELPYAWSVSSSIKLRTRHGYGSANVKAEEWIWNARISKSFLKGNLLASFVAYDILHQHQAVNYYVSTQMRTVTFTNTIPRYMLLDLQYKINIMPKKKISNNTHYY